MTAARGRAPLSGSARLRSARDARVLAFSGPSGAGKTTLIVALIALLRRRGLAVCALKRSGHPHAFDRPGKDTARMREAGALAVAIQGPAGLALFAPPVGGMRELARLLPRADLVVAEGFADEPVARIEVHHSRIERSFRYRRDPRLLAVVSDVEPPWPIPWFTREEVEALADLVARFARARPEPPRRRPVAARPPRGHRDTRREDQLRENAMPRTPSTRTRSGAGGARGKKGSGARRGGATVSEAGRKGGRRTLERRGPEFYSEIGRKGGRSSGSTRRRSTAPRAKASSAGAPRRKTSARPAGGRGSRSAPAGRRSAASRRGGKT